MSPLEIGICLHYHSSVTDDPWIDSGALIVNETIASMIHDGLLIDTMSSGRVQRYRPTEKLHAFVSMLEETPLPEPWWVDVRTGKQVRGYGLNL